MSYPSTRQPLSLSCRDLPCANEMTSGEGATHVQRHEANMASATGTRGPVG